MLLDMSGLGDDRPSTLMDRMLALLGDNNPDFIFKELFLRQLPLDVRTAIANTPYTDMSSLAQAADQVWLSRAARQTCSAIMESEIEQDLEQVASIRTGKGKKQGKATSTSSKPPATGNSYCFYHNRFGERSTRCKPPCTYKQQGNGPASRQ